MLLRVTKESWVFIDLEWVSEIEIVKERLFYSDEGSISFDDLILVSQFDNKHRLISEDLASINE